MFFYALFGNCRTNLALFLEKTSSLYFHGWVHFKLDEKSNQSLKNFFSNKSFYQALILSSYPSAHRKLGPKYLHYFISIQLLLNVFLFTRSTIFELLNILSIWWQYLTGMFHKIYTNIHTTDTRCLKSLILCGPNSNPNTK